MKMSQKMNPTGRRRKRNIWRRSGGTNSSWNEGKEQS